MARLTPKVIPSLLVRGARLGAERERRVLPGPPEVMEYGWRELAVRHPDGYLLAFAEPA